MRVLIVEDVPGLRQHAARVVKEVVPSAEIVEADNGSEGLRVARSCSPDLIIMDISMPEMSGIKAAQQIWSECPDRRILFWSQYHREAYVRELGRIVPDEAIHGYALKSEPDEKLRLAIKCVLLHDDPYIDPLVRGVQERLETRDSSLSDAEFETLLDLVTGLTDKAIAARRHISVRGVQNRLAALAEKLIKSDLLKLRSSTDMELFNLRTRMVFEALRRGLLDPDEIGKLEDELREWVEDEFDYEMKD